LPEPLPCGSNEASCKKSSSSSLGPLSLYLLLIDDADDDDDVFLLGLSEYGFAAVGFSYC
jgi:hypothetical protein